MTARTARRLALGALLALTALQTACPPPPGYFWRRERRDDRHERHDDRRERRDDHRGDRHDERDERRDDRRERRD